MAQKDLIPFNRRTEEEQKRIASMGGKKSGEVRREQKTYREMAKAMLSAQITDPKMLKEMAKYGIDGTDLKAYTLLGMIKASGNGSHNAFDRLMELTGEKEQNQNENVISKLDEVLSGVDEVMGNE